MRQRIAANAEASLPAGSEPSMVCGRNNVRHTNRHAAIRLNRLMSAESTTAVLVPGALPGRRDAVAKEGCCREGGVLPARAVWGRNFRCGAGTSVPAPQRGSPVPSDAERVGDAVDVVEPRRDQRDLQDATVVEAGLPQAIVMLGRDPRRVACDLLDVLEHDAVLCRDRRRPEVP